jgi:hypothetical protein
MQVCFVTANMHNGSAKVNSLPSEDVSLLQANTAVFRIWIDWL